MIYKMKISNEKKKKRMKAKQNEWNLKDKRNKNLIYKALLIRINKEKDKNFKVFHMKVNEIWLIER
jgi:hypothetical protein